MIKISQCFSVLWSLPKTLYFNFRCFPLRVAIRMPVFVHHSFKLNLQQPHIIFSNTARIKTFVVRFGSRGSKGVIPNNHGCICIEKGTVEFGGFATFAYGSSIRVSGVLKIGNNFSANRNSFIACSKAVTIDEDVLTGWDIAIRDTDGHTITQNGIPKPSQKEVIIGKHVWICSYAHILKGVTIGENSIVGAGSVVTKCIPDNQIWAGNPAKFIRKFVEK